METNDVRIAQARRVLAEARQREPGELPPGDLAREDAELRRCLAWALEVVDDLADTEIDENVTQVRFCGALHIAPADVATLCGRCLSRLLGDQQCPPSETSGPQAPCAA
jgi:hypothetical protein